MKTKFIPVFALVAVLAACTHEPPKSVTPPPPPEPEAAAAPVAPQVQQVAIPASTPTQAEFVAHIVSDHVFFAYDSSMLDGAAMATLDSQIAWAQAHPQVKFTIEGHTDERGTREYNLALGQRRAVAAQAYMVAHGVRADRVNTLSYGKERPEDGGSNEAAWAHNRRAVSIIVQ